MNSVFSKFCQSQKGFFEMLTEYRKLQNNPSAIGQLLFNAGRISQEQLADIEKMNSPKQIGEYLLQNNSDFQKMYNGK